jgi:NitT/TauT family transport system permease protein
MKLIKKLFRPFHETSNSKMGVIKATWLLLILSAWTIMGSIGDTHLFPTPMQVINGFGKIWSDGLINHLSSSLILCGTAVLYSSIISVIIAYASTLLMFKDMSKFVSVLRYLPLTGITFYISIFVNDARTIQIWVLVMFMSTFLVTGLSQMIKDIPEEEFQHARTLGCNRWEMLWEVVIKGRLDYVFELIRQNLAIVWMMLVSIESILIAAGGLGVIIKNHDRMGENGAVIAAQIVIILVGIFLDFFLTKFRRTFFKFSNY